VTARVFRVGTADYKDGNLQLDNSRAADRKCVTFGLAAYPRKLTIQYPDQAVAQTNTGGLNVFDMGTVGAASATRAMNIRIVGTGARCTNLQFGSVAGSTPVTVTRTSTTSWSVALSAGTAVCTPPSGTTFPISGFTFAFTVTLN
jgi:hypothetical protein